jgi:hypothetical protein
MTQTSPFAGLSFNLNKNQQLVLDPDSSTQFYLETAQKPNEHKYYIRCKKTNNYLTVEGNDVYATASAPSDSSLFYFTPLQSQDSGIQLSIGCSNDTYLQGSINKSNDPDNDFKFVVQATGTYSDEPSCRISLISLASWDSDINHG